MIKFLDKELSTEYLKKHYMLYSKCEFLFCETWNDLYYYMNNKLTKNNDPYGPYITQLKSAKSLEDMFKRIQKSKNCILIKYDDNGYEDEIDWDNSLGVCMLFDKMSIYGGGYDYSVHVDIYNVCNLNYKQVEYLDSDSKLILSFTYLDNTYFINFSKY